MLTSFWNINFLNKTLIEFIQFLKVALWQHKILKKWRDTLVKLSKKWHNVFEVWYEKKNHRRFNCMETIPKEKSLLIFGARQVGKTYIIEDFAKSNYSADKIITMNFELFPEAKMFFENDLSSKAIMRKIQSNIKYMHVNFKDDENNPYLIFLDEIQSCEKRNNSVKSVYAGK